MAIIIRNGHGTAVAALLFTLAVAATASTLAADSGEADAFQAFANLETTELGSLRGMNGNTEVTVQTNQDLEATVSGSTFTVDTLSTGGVTFEAGALESFSGVGLFNVITGNNNAVDAAVGVSFTLQ